MHTTGADTCFCSMLFLEVMLLLLVVIQVHCMLYSSHKFYLFMLSPLCVFIYASPVGDGTERFILSNSASLEKVFSIKQ